MPIEPVMTAASPDRMSPNTSSITTASDSRGAVMMRIAAGCYARPSSRLVVPMTAASSGTNSVSSGLEYGTGV